MAAVYINNKDTVTQDELFALLYETVQSNFKSDFPRIAFWANTTEHDVHETFDRTLVQCIKRYQERPNDFVNLFSSSFSNAKKNLKRDIGRHKKRFLLEPNKKETIDDEQKNSFLDRLAEKNKCQKNDMTHEHRRELINYLTEQANDPKIETIISKWFELAEDGVKPTIRAVSAALNLNYETVRKRIMRLQKFYDESRFGPVETFFAS